MKRIFELGSAIKQYVKAKRIEAHLQENAHDIISKRILMVRKSKIKKNKKSISSALDRNNFAPRNESSFSNFVLFSNIIIIIFIITTIFITY